MVAYPNGHSNLTHQQPYAQQVAPMAADSMRRDTAPRRRRTKWLIAVGELVVILLFAGGVAGVVATKVAQQTSSSAPTTSSVAALEQWWSQAQDDFHDLQKASQDVQQALSRFKPGALLMACQHVHDAAEVRMQMHLPSPSAELTAELHAAIEDFHAAAHMCLAVAAGSPTNYDGEFMSSMSEANIHMRAAEDIIKRLPTRV